MKDTRLIMGMPITVEIVDTETAPDILEAVFAYFKLVDERFSTYKDTSEIMAINRGEITIERYSKEMQEILSLAEKTKQESGGYFNIKKPEGQLDPSGIVKGWAIKNAALLLEERGIKNFYVEAGGDIQVRGSNIEGKDWSVGIRNPFSSGEIVKIIFPRGKGVATSGNYERGNHIYNPLSPLQPLEDIRSITVVGPDVLEADRFATAAFAMGTRGIQFIESLANFEAYSIDMDGIATMTSGFSALTT